LSFLFGLLSYSFPRIQFFQDLYMFIEFLFRILSSLFRSVVFLNSLWVQLYVCILFEFIQLLIHLLSNFIDHSISSSSLLPKSFIVELLDFERDTLPCFSYYLCFYIEIYASGVEFWLEVSVSCDLLVGDFSDYLKLSSVWIVVYFLATRLWGYGSEVKH
jgi:hypothetical protein